MLPPQKSEVKKMKKAEIDFWVKDLQASTANQDSDKAADFLLKFKSQVNAEDYERFSCVLYGYQLGFKAALSLKNFTEEPRTKIAAPMPTPAK